VLIHVFLFCPVSARWVRRKKAGGDILRVLGLRCAGRPYLHLYWGSDRAKWFARSPLFTAALSADGLLGSIPCPTIGIFHFGGIMAHIITLLQFSVPALLAKATKPFSCNTT
jgi:hypothetical protein